MIIYIYSFLFILVFHFFCIIDHIVDFFFWETTWALNANGLFFSSGFILGWDMNNAIGVDIESDFNLRDSPRGRRNTLEIELA